MQLTVLIKNGQLTVEGISESSVNKKFMSIYTKLQVSGKKELYKLVISSILDKQ